MARKLTETEAKLIELVHTAYETGLHDGEFNYRVTYSPETMPYHFRERMTARWDQSRACTELAALIKEVTQ